MAWSAAYTPATEAGLHKLRIEEGATELFMLCIDLGKTTFFESDDPTRRGSVAEGYLHSVKRNSWRQQIWQKLGVP